MVAYPVENSANQRRVFVVGLDGATLDLIEPWTREGLLPNLAALMETGSYGPLTSTVPPISAPAWASFMTGVNPGKHGIYEFQAHVPNSYRQRLVNGADVRAPTMWRRLNDAGKHTIALNVAMTYPPEELEKAIILAGVDAPGTGSHYAHPAELVEELQRAIGEYIIEPGVVEHCRRGRHDLAFQAIMDALERRFAAVDYLMRTKPWDLFVVNYRATDNIQHHFWQFMDASHPVHDATGGKAYGDSILKVYRRLDAWLGELRQRLDGDTTLIVMSDHGAGPASPIAMYYNRWLAREGLLTFAGQQKGDVAGRLKAGVLALQWKVIWGYLRKWVGKRTKDAMRRRFPTLFDRARTQSAYAAIDWPNTKAYSDEFRDAIWVNLKGREPSGCVEPGADYEDVRDQIIEAARQLVDPDGGMRIVEEIYRREEIYSGPYVEDAPDLVLVLRQEPYVRTRLSHTTHSPEPIQQLTREQLIADYLVMGFHRSNGICFMQGAGIHAGRRLEGAQIVDLAPTILHLLGMEVPREMDGRVLTEALIAAGDIRYAAGTPAEVAAGDHPAGEGYSDEEEAAVREKLSGLGYLG
jgi:predicted AlkP superfamily phosphohydrolase/phosphomutase